MNKQPISVTLSPDNLLWLKGRARIAAAGSMSEFLDQLITQARFGQATPPPVRSMKGALGGLGGEADLDFDLSAIRAEMEQAWQVRWAGIADEVEGRPLSQPGSGLRKPRAAGVPAHAARSATYRGGRRG
jgi:hypothetical protein